MKRRDFEAAFVEVATIMLLLSTAYGGIRLQGTFSTNGRILYNKQPTELGLRTDAFWDEYIKNPYEFLNLAGGKVTLVYFDLPWVKELFCNFDPNQLDMPFAKGTFRDYVNFFRVINQNGIKIVLAISGRSNSSKTNLDFFLEYPNSAVDSQWVNPDYVDPTWNGKTFLDMYAYKINSFTSFVGIPTIVAVEDWRYPGYMMQHSQLTRLKDDLKSMNETNDLWMPPASFGSAGVADYNAFEENHTWVSEFSSDGMTVGGSDAILQGVWDTYQVYHSSVNVAGWIGAQMSTMPYGSSIILKLYFGGQDLGLNNPGYNLVEMKKKLEDIIVASYLTRILTPNGEYCPVKGFILVYKPPPLATLGDMLDILQYAQTMEPLKYAKIIGPVLAIPKDLGYSTYFDRTSPMSGYLIGTGLVPFRFVLKDNIPYLSSNEKIVTQSGKDFSADFNLIFNTSTQCTWLAVVYLNGQDFFVVFHDGGYESAVYMANGTIQAADTSSYKQNAMINLNNSSINIPADSVIFLDSHGTPVNSLF